MPIETGLGAAKEIVFVENNLPDLQSVLAGLRPGVEVVLLDSAGDGLAQMADALRGRTGIDAIHIVSHGAAGALDLGATTLSAATLAEHAGALDTIGAALAAGGDILLYGCDAAAGGDGQALLAGLAALTHADVAASTDPTGAAGQGGDWQLEAHTGAIAAATCFTDAFTVQYEHLLANARPTLGYISVIMGGKEDTPGVITFADLMAAATVSDPDGTVTAFRIIGGYSGGFTYKVGTSLETANADDLIIDATHNLYYTPPADEYMLPGSGQGLVEVVAVDNLGAQSFGSADVYVNLAPVNDAPHFGYGNYVQGVMEDTSSPDHEDVSDPANHPVANRGSDIASLMRNSAYQDKEYDASGTGIAISGNDADPVTQGRWQYSTDGKGEFWHDVGTVSASSALLLAEGGGITYLRFVPVAEFSGKPGSLTVHAVDGSDTAMQFSSWDGTTEHRYTFDTTTDDDATSPVSVAGVEWQTSVYPINDIPVLTGLDGADNQTVFASDDAVLVDKTQDVALTDVDSPDFENGYVGVAITSGRDAGDVLAIRTDADVRLSAGMSFNSTVSVGGVDVGTIGYGATGAGQDLGIYLMAGATPANIARLLRHITFDATGGVAGERTITMQASDGDGGASAIGTSVVSVVVAPTVSITSNRTSLRAGDEAHIIFTFSEAPTDFDFADITVVGGELVRFQNIGDPRMYDAVFVPTPGIQSTSASVSIAAGKFTSALGTANAASTGNAAMTVDTKAPTLTLSADKTTVKAGEKVAVTFTFDEPPVGFNQGYVSYSGGVLSNFQATADNKVFTATFTPSGNLDNVNATISVGANAYVDAVGNRGTGSNVLAIGGDTRAPTVDIALDKTAVMAGDTVAVTFTFSEAPAGFAADAVSVTGGTLTNLQAGTDGKVYTATFTPAASDNLSAMISIAAGAYTDAAGNAGLASNFRLVTGDTRGPTVTVDSSATRLKAGETATITFTFSEAPVGFDDADVQVAGGTLGPVAASATDPKVYTATFTPTAGAGDIAASVAVRAGGYTDATGNAGAAGHVAIGADTLAPTLAITSDKSVLKAGETATVTFTFSEAPLHFDDADLAVSGGTLGPVAATADPKVFTATFTPAAADVLNASVGLAAVHYTDAAGNPGAPATAVTFGGDTRTPTLAITADTTRLHAGQSAVLTLTFSEAPAGFDAGDIAHAGGTLGTLTATADPKVFTIAFTPDARDSLAAWVEVGAGSWTDAAGNAGGAGAKVDFGGDTLAPTVSVASDRATVKAGETATLTFTFSEAPQGFADGDVSVTGGSVSGLAASADPKVYTATFTPTAGLDVVDATVAVHAGAYADAAGNDGAAGNTVAIGGDTRAPGVTISADKTAVKAGDTVALTFTFTEAPAGLDADDIAVSGGTLTNFHAGTDGKVYTATFTPAASDNLSATVGIAAGAYTDAAANAGLASNVLAISGDTRGPTVTVDTSATRLTAGETATITFTFSEAPVGFDDADVQVAGGTLGPVAASATDPKIYTATFTPTAGAGDIAASVAVRAGGYTDAAGNAGAAGHVAIGADTLAPTLVITSDKSVLKAGETATVTFTFSEAPQGFDADDIVVGGGSIADLAATADPKVYTATFTPAAGQAALAATVGVAAGSFTDAAGNANPAGGAVASIAGDTLAPTVTDARLDIAGGTGPNDTLRIGDVVTVSWNNGPGGDANPDVAGVTADFSALGGGSAVAARQVGGGVWQASFTVAAGQLDATGRNVAITVTDTAGNAVTRSDGTGATIDNVAPLVGAGAIVLGGATGTGGTFRAGDVVTVGWSGESNTDIVDVKVDFSAFGGGAAVAATRGADGWSASWQIPAGTLDAGGMHVVLTATDDAGNAVARVSAAGAAVDNAAPRVTAIAPSGTPAANATEVEFTVTLSEAVTGVDAGDFVLAGTGATTGRIASVTGSGASYTVKVDGIAGNGTLRLDLKGDGTGIADHAGNGIGGGYTAGAAHTASFNAAPQIVSNDGGASAAIGIAEGTKRVTTVVATDADHDAITYGITGGADAALFEIDAATGVLTLRGVQGHATPADSDHDGRYEVQVGATDGKGGSDTQALTVTVLRDLDGDGVPDVDDTDKDNDGGPDAAEDGVPSLGTGHGDGNGDGRADGEQLNVASLATVVAGNPYATLAVAEGLTLKAVSAKPAPTGLPRNVKLPTGVLDFTIDGVATGGTVTVSLYVDKTLGVNAYYKQNNSGAWVNIAKSVTTVDNKTKITFDLTDGGIFDSDRVANGSIVDPGGAAQVAPLITSNGGTPEAAVSIVEGTRGVTSAKATATSPVTWSLGGADAALFEIDAATGALRFRAAPSHDRPLDEGGTPRDNVYVVDLTATDAYGSDTQTLKVGVQRDPGPTLPAPVQSTVDGVQVTTGSIVNADGSISQVITVPVVQPGRVDQVGDHAAADIPLAASGGQTVLTAQVPVGLGLQATGSDGAGTVGTSLVDLVRAITAHTADGSHDQASMTDGGSGFLAGLPADAALFVKTIVPGVAAGTPAPTDPLVISGTPAGAGAPLTALVIDGRGLPAGSTIALQHVDFAAIVGAVTVNGGAGAQTVWGDGASQTIFLGEGDDVLHGGAGNDTVGSAGGNDWIFGDEGDDVVFGGAGNDTIDGGTGHDTVVLAGAGRADYSMRIKDGAVVMTHLGGGADGTDVVSNVEALRYAGQAADSDFNHSEIADLVRLYGTAFGRLADTDGINFWIGAWESGMSIARLADAFMDSAEAQAAFGALSNAQFVARLYDVALHRSGSAAEVAWWAGQLDQGVVDRGDVLVEFAASEEKVGLVGVVTTSIETA
ncbi:Ig-like domain-containing protein [uncultured Massilia sp.]|uniref:Ig-like domain-containing protein n=1 Tax=uncultured Massilia sp. TaxID=169973 RepID=UPI0025CE1DFD|nr:Ig-like domain-containing protein [uncultured Massilia sp.]